MDNIEILDQDSSTPRSERQRWERPTLSEASLRNFTDSNYISGTDGDDS